MNASVLVGVFFAIFATFSWALNFISPYVIGAYTAYDFVSARFLFCGIVGAIFIYCSDLSVLGRGDILRAFCLGLLGYVGYIACIMGGVIFAGPVIPPAFLALVPVLLVVLGNATRRTMPWARLTLPLALAATGLVLVNLGVVLRSETPAGRSPLIGMAFSVGAVALWLIFSLLNQRALDRNPHLRAGLWTGLMMLGGGVGIALFLPLGLALGMSSFPALGFGWTSAGHLYLWAFGLACVSSVAGAWAWNLATQRLPMAVTGQLISIETVFATIFGLVAQSRPPRWDETIGIVLLIAGAVTAVRAFLLVREPGRARTDHVATR